MRGFHHPHAVTYAHDDQHTDHHTVAHCAFSNADSYHRAHGDRHAYANDDALTDCYQHASAAVPGLSTSYSALASAFGNRFCLPQAHEPAGGCCFPLTSPLVLVRNPRR